MKFDLMYQFTTPSRERGTVAPVYHDQLEQIALADQLGFDGVWLSEHHFTESNYLPSPLVMAGAVAMRTERLQIGIGVAPAPFYNPLRLAEDCAVADNLCGGRLALGVGIGYRNEEYRGYGFERGHRAAYLEESIEVLRRAWSDGPFSHHGRFFDFDDADCTPKPLRERTPLWVAGVSDPAIRRAARLGDGWFATGIDSDQFATYHSELAASGKASNSLGVAAVPFGWVYSSEDPERDWEILGPHAIREINLFAGWSAPGLNLTSVEEVKQIGQVHVARPDELTAMFLELHSRIPLDRIVFAPNLRGAPVNLGNRSLELLAGKVIPAVRQAIG